MVLKTIRNNLSIGLALVAAIASAYAYIGRLKYNQLQANMEAVEAFNARVVAVNDSQAAAIGELTRQREIDDQILVLLSEQQTVIQAQGSDVREQLEELASNDQEIRDLFSLRLPPSTIRLLNEQATGRSSDPAENTNQAPGESSD